MNILMTGAGGFIGSHLVAALDREGYSLTLAVRDVRAARQRWPWARVIHADFSRDHDIAQWMERLTDIDVVINTVGIIAETRTQRFDALHRDAPCALFKACARVGVERVIQISALGADETAFSQYHLTKRAADACLLAQNINGTVLMPSIVYGPGANSMNLFRAMAALPLIPLIDQGGQRIQPIHVDDLVRVVIRLLQSSVLGDQRIELVGPQPMTLRELYGALRHWLGYGVPRFVSMPYRIALSIASVAGALFSTPLNRASMQMLQQGNTGDVRPLQYRFGCMPMSVQDALDRTPALPADRWFARLYFLLPLLRFSLALLWIFTGYISACVYPLEQSYLLLNRTGVSDQLAPLVLYAAAGLDVMLGLALLFRYRVITVDVLQIATIGMYTLIITLAMPEFWWHPFGPSSKNIPLLMATLIMLATERR